MQVQVYRTLNVLSELVAPVPIGTNLGLVHLLYAMLSGEFLVSRGAVIPALAGLGLPDDAVRRGWAALGQGHWQTPVLVDRWERQVGREGLWLPNSHGGWRPVAVDTTCFPRPRLVDCPTKHYEGKTGKAVPAIPVGLIVRVGQVGGQRLGIPAAMVRPPADDPSREAHARVLVRQAAKLLRPDEVAVLDRGFVISMLQEEGVERFTVRLLRNFTARRAVLPEYKGTGRRPTRGELVRPLARVRKGQVYPATPPDHTESWEEEGVTLRADWWYDLVLPTGTPDSPRFHVVAVYDPQYEGPLLAGIRLPGEVVGEVARDLYRDRWPVEQVPLAAKQMIGLHRQFVHDPETRQRLPELALLAGSVLSYLAATMPAVPTGFWDRKPQPTAGRLRRVLAKAGFPEDYVLDARLRRKRSQTGHLPKGDWDQPRRHAVRLAAVSA